MWFSPDELVDYRKAEEQQVYEIVDRKPSSPVKAAKSRQTKSPKAKEQEATPEKEAETAG